MSKRFACDPIFMLIFKEHFASSEYLVFYPALAHYVGWYLQADGESRTSIIACKQNTVITSYFCKKDF